MLSPKVNATISLGSYDILLCLLNWGTMLDRWNTNNAFHLSSSFSDAHAYSYFCYSDKRNVIKTETNRQFRVCVDKRRSHRYIRAIFNDLSF